MTELQAEGAITLSPLEIVAMLDARDEGVDMAEVLSAGVTIKSIDVEATICDAWSADGKRRKTRQTSTRRRRKKDNSIKKAGQEKTYVPGQGSITADSYRSWADEQIDLRLPNPK